MRRPPVLDQGASGVPADPPVELLEVALAALAGCDRVSLPLEGPRHQADELIQVEGAAERAARARKDPGRLRRRGRSADADRPPGSRRNPEAPRRKGTRRGPQPGPRRWAAVREESGQDGSKGRDGQEAQASTERWVRSGSQPAPSRPGAGTRSSRVMLPPSHSSAKAWSPRPRRRWPRGPRVPARERLQIGVTTGGRG